MAIARSTSAFGTGHDTLLPGRSVGRNQARHEKNKLEDGMRHGMPTYAYAYVQPTRSRSLARSANAPPASQPPPQWDIYALYCVIVVARQLVPYSMIEATSAIEGGNRGSRIYVLLSFVSIGSDLLPLYLTVVKVLRIIRKLATVPFLPSFLPTTTGRPTDRPPTSSQAG